MTYVQKQIKVSNSITLWLVVRKRVSVTQSRTHTHTHILQVLQLLEVPILTQFNYAFGELSKLYVEAKDNVKFLTTLERHFKNITTGSFSTIQETLPSMMHAIRMVWIISRHYNTDERMVPLMERIAFKLSEKVQTEVDIKTILKLRPLEAKKIIKEAKEVLVMWREYYGPSYKYHFATLANDSS